MFPGSGTSTDAAQPLQNGELCDAVAGAAVATAGDVTRCFFTPDDRQNPAATVEQVLECAEGTNTLHLRLTFDPHFVDNTYGDGSIGWPQKRGHRFRDLTGSDHAELVVLDGDGEVALQFKIDYLTADATAVSGFASLGVDGGDGAVVAGSREHIVATATSLEKNLNERGYSDYIEHSPITDESYAPNPDAPEWDYRMVYEAWIDLEAFGAAGFSGAFIDFVHASPSKGSSDTIEVTPDDCPPGWDPKCEDPAECADTPPGEEECEPGLDEDCGDGTPPNTGTPLDPCMDDDPDTFCGDGTPPDVPNGGEPAYCDRYPSDPACHVE